MYSYEDRMGAIELYLRYDRSAAAVINELGCPNRQTLRLWHMEFAENGGLSRGRHRRHDDLRKRAAVDHFFDHGRCLARTARQLGYPKSKELLASWVDELGPGRRRRRAKAGSFTDGQKREAVIALASRKAAAQEVADAAGATRAVLYKWKNRLLGRRRPARWRPRRRTWQTTSMRSGRKRRSCGSRSRGSSCARRSWKERSSSWEKAGASTLECWRTGRRPCSRTA